MTIPAGLGEFAVAAELINFVFARFQECLRLIDVIAAARNFASSADSLRNRFFLAKANLSSWLDLVMDAKDDQNSPLRDLDWILVKDTIAQLEEILSNAEILEKKYGMEIVPTDEHLLGSDVSSPPVSVDFFSKTLAKLRSPRPKLATSQKLQETSNIWRQTRWGFTGRTNFTQLVDDMEARIQALMVLTTSRQLNHLIKRQERLFTEILVRAHSRQDVDNVNNVLSQHESTERIKTYYQTSTMLSQLKAHRMRLGIDVTETELREHVEPSSNRNKPPRSIILKSLQMQHIQSIGIDRATAVYRGNQVLLEYKRIPANLRDKLEHRVRALGTLLAQSDSSVLATLQCLGLYDDFTAERYAFVFKPPNLYYPPQASTSPSVNFINMRECLLNYDMSEPTQTQRVRIAVVLATALLNLHTVGWLHKCVRSENVLFLGSTPSNVDFINSTAGPYLAGFGYARAANPTEVSEIPLTSSEIDLLCHAATVGPSPHKSYRKVFDIFAFGILLLEIMLWKRFGAILKEALQPTDPGGATDELALIPLRDELLRRNGDGSIMDKLRQTGCPAAYCRAVEMCLCERPQEEWDDLDDSLYVQHEVLDLLSSTQSAIDSLSDAMADVGIAR